MKKIVVPEGMLRVAENVSLFALEPELIEKIVEASLCWLLDEVERLEFCSTDYKNFYAMFCRPSTLPLQCGERFNIREQTWEVQKISRSIATIRCVFGGLEFEVPEVNVLDAAHMCADLLPKSAASFTALEAQRRILEAFFRGQRLK